ncbi:MAG: hypothetical protein AAF754_17840 [Pseudomonadota bacterium]
MASKPPVSKLGAYIAEQRIEVLVWCAIFFISLFAFLVLWIDWAGLVVLIALGTAVVAGAFALVASAVRFLRGNG